MKYIALLRGINVGGNNKVEMKRLKEIFESSGCTCVSTYINSGNVFFESNETRETLQKKTETALKKEFAFDIPLLIKTKKEMKKIADAIPETWQNVRIRKQMWHICSMRLILQKYLTSCRSKKNSLKLNMSREQ